MKKRKSRRKNCDSFNYTSFEYKGKVYRNYTELAKELNIPSYLLRRRLREGKLMTEAVKAQSFREKPITDATGKHFKSISEMARCYGINRSTLAFRMKRGYSMDNIIAKKNLLQKPITDYKGNTYGSQKEMCDAYGINARVYIYRMRANWNQERALTTPVGKYEYRKTKAGI